MVTLPGRCKDVSLDVVRRVDGAGRADLFFLSMTSVLRAGGRDPNNMNQGLVQQWLSQRVDVKVGKRRLDGPSFLSVCPNETHFVKLHEALGNAERDPLDRWFVSLSAAVFLLVRAENEIFSAKSAAFDFMRAAVRALVRAHLMLRLWRSKNKHVRMLEALL